jgi:hypothetical protein
VPVLAHRDVDAVVSLGTFNGDRDGAAIVNGDFLWQIVQVDGAIEEPPGRSRIALDGEQKIRRIPVPIDGAVAIFSRA